jgi:hypothetical protein
MLQGLTNPHIYIPVSCMENTVNKTFLLSGQEGAVDVKYESNAASANGQYGIPPL